jgi:hypothetical protein
LAGFCFRNAGDLVDLDYLGLVRHKKQDRTLIVPVVAVIDEDSESPWLEPSNTWLERAKLNRDQIWVDNSDCRELIDGSDSDMITGNTAGIVEYFQSTKAIQANM